MQRLTHDEIFTNPLLASVYDPLEADRPGAEFVYNARKQ